MMKPMKHSWATGQSPDMSCHKCIGRGKWWESIEAANAIIPGIDKSTPTSSKCHPIVTVTPATGIASNDVHTLPIWFSNSTASTTTVPTMKGKKGKSNAILPARQLKETCVTELNCSVYSHLYCERPNLFPVTKTTKLLPLQYYGGEIDGNPKFCLDCLCQH